MIISIFFFSNTGSSVPDFLARGDLAESDEFNSKWMLFENAGDFTFSDVGKETRVSDFEFALGSPCFQILIWMEGRTWQLLKIM